jgi:hypothetical protein
VEYHFKDDRLHIMRTVDEKKQLLQRLNRIEGQVRGLRNMVENDRYAGDEVQQASAITAAVRSGRLAPMITLVTTGWWRSQASATCGTVQPFSAATSRTAAITVLARLRSTGGKWADTVEKLRNRAASQKWPILAFFCRSD